MEVSDPKNIPMKILRAHIPDFKSKSRTTLVEHLGDVNRPLLDALAFRYTQLKHKNLYLYKYSEKLDIKQIGKLVDTQIHETDTDIITQVEKILHDIKKDEIYFQLKLHTEKKVFSGEDPETLELFSQDYRKPFYGNYIIHPKDKIIECITRNGRKANIATKRLSQLLFDSPTKIQQIMIPYELQQQLDENIRCKKATITNIDFAGTNKLTLEGEDVLQTISELKRKKIDLLSMGASIQYDKSIASEKPFDFHADGRITVNKRTDDYYSILKTIL